MEKQAIYTQDWLKIHPYRNVQPTDMYYTRLANRLYSIGAPTGMSAPQYKRVCLYVAAYLEDLLSHLGLWHAFTRQNRTLYGKMLPFYETGNDYMTDEPNEADIRFILWNTWQKDVPLHTYLHPADPRIITWARSLYRLVERMYEEIPENELLTGYFLEPVNEKETARKLEWLFGHTYLTEPSVLPYVGRMSASDRFIIPTGPHALFLYEWIDLLSGRPQWKQVEGLYPAQREIPSAIKDRQAENYRNFLEGTGGKRVVFLDGYAQLRHFLVHILKWEDDDNHTLPQLRANRDFVLMAHPDKGILLAKDICACIASPDNRLYSKEEAHAYAFRLLTEETCCPPDLLTYCLENNFLPDACIPGTDDTATVQQNADFIARHALLYYYRGD